MPLQAMLLPQLFCVCRTVVRTYVLASLSLCASSFCLVPRTVECCLFALAVSGFERVPLHSLAGLSLLAGRTNQMQGERQMSLPLPLCPVWWSTESKFRTTHNWPAVRWFFYRVVLALCGPLTVSACLIYLVRLCE